MDVLGDGRPLVNDSTLLGAVVDAVAVLANLTFEQGVVLDLVDVLLLDSRQVMNLEQFASQARTRTTEELKN